MLVAVLPAGRHHAAGPVLPSVSPSLHPRGRATVVLITPSPVIDLPIALGGRRPVILGQRQGRSSASSSCDAAAWVSRAVVRPP
ncbi:hypothetical protein E2562_025579 [Oryza meyeriana var. granulata]|uniref:Uncharacterized protein n=1 Tax=Oryza meyeriana var. granulata TaxID=110450 RepID=A0A6G1E0K7_9ORYZ|nr:hypothetical protein E2562_025579 [Oryza meyeriana var. granulata]